MAGDTDKVDDRHEKISRWRIAAWSAAALMLLLPGVAMQFTDEVAWSAGDFAAFAAMLAVAGAAFELAARRTRDKAYRAAVGIALAAAFLLVWANEAVGLIGSEDNPANLMFYGVLGVGIGGAVVARFRPRAMARVMVVTALAPVLVAAIALVAGWGRPPPLAIGFFVVLWLVSAWLFRRSGATSGPV